MPDVPIAFNHQAADTDEVNQLRQMGLKHELRHPHHSLIDAAYMVWARAQGYRVNAWTVNDPARAVELRDLGVDNITTDTPDVILAALRGT
jgi:glycerophosphoryl diester phosphodiesterase